MVLFPVLPEMVDGPMRGREHTYILTEDLVMPNGDIVRRGFTTDGISIPKWAQPLLGPHDGEAFCAAIAHDYRYRFSRLSRKEVDRLFLADMKQTGPGRVKRRLLYLGVRAGGGKVWRSYRRDPYLRLS